MNDEWDGWLTVRTEDLGIANSEVKSGRSEDWDSGQKP
jgi:hypothetical protein